MVGKVVPTNNFSHRQDFPSFLEIPATLEVLEQDCRYVTKSTGPRLAINDSMTFTLHALYATKVAPAASWPASAV